METAFSTISACMPKITKKYAAKAALLKKKEYPIGEAVSLLTELSTSSFDGTAEVHIRVNADPAKGDQQVRSTVSLPHGTGKELRIAAAVPDDLVDDAKKAGAALAGEENIISDIEKGKIDFDILIAVPSVMKNLGKVAKTLGQKGLMPNPKAGTVTDDPAMTIQELKKGRVEIRMDKQAIIHSVFGKISFGKEKLEENLRTLLQAVREARPAGIKGDYLKSVTITPTMGPGIRVEGGTI
jgi:large subunit ribosomal protein L1